MIAKHTEKKELLFKDRTISSLKKQTSFLLHFLIISIHNRATNKWIDMCQS